MLDRVQVKADLTLSHTAVDGFFAVADDLLGRKGIHAGDNLSYSDDIGDLVPGRIYLVREREESDMVARVYVRDAAGERFATACSVPAGFWRTAGTVVEGAVVGVVRPVW